MKLHFLYMEINKKGRKLSFEYIKRRNEIVMQRSSDIKGRIKGRQLDGRPSKDQKKTSRVDQSQVTPSYLFSGLRG